MKKIIPIVILGILLIGGYIAWGRAEQGDAGLDDTNLETNTPTSTPSTGTDTTYTLDQIAAHNNAADCWTAINGKVYNLTSWISKHPGGQQAILGICSKDASTIFNNKHGGMQKQAEILATFLIGTLK
jgi:cytochrome b involved in lipid metabolism